MSQKLLLNFHEGQKVEPFIEGALVIKERDGMLFSHSYASSSYIGLTRENYDLYGDLLEPKKLVIHSFAFENVLINCVGKIFQRSENNVDNPNFLEGNCCYLSQPGDAVFGHWLIQHLPRLWHYSQMLHEEKFKIIVRGRSRKIYKTLRFLIEKIPNCDGVILMNENTDVMFQVESLFVSNIFPSNRMIDPIVRDFRGWFFSLSQEKNLEVPKVDLEKVFLSRGKWNRGDARKLINREEIEVYFESQGYTILYPEEYPLETLCALLSKTRVIAGERGSALHISLLLKEVRKVIVLAYDSDPSPMFPQQSGIGTACGQETVYILGSGQRLEPFHEKNFRFQISINSLAEVV